MDTAAQAAKSMAQATALGTAKARKDGKVRGRCEQGEEDTVARRLAVVMAVAVGRGSDWQQECGWADAWVAWRRPSSRRLSSPSSRVPATFFRSPHPATRRQRRLPSCPAVPACRRRRRPYIHTYKFY